MTMRNLKIKSGAIACILIAVAAVLIAAASTKNTPSSTEKPKANRLAPGPHDGRIAYITATLMEDFQYSHQPLDESISEKFFDQYLETLDPRRENFLQSDIDSFSHYRTNLDAYTIGNGKAADLTPAYKIYERFKERVTQHAAYVDELLKRDHLKFNNDDTLALDRRHAPWPKDLAAAKRLWRNRLRYEFLQEKLAREISPTNAEIILPMTRSNLTDIATQLRKHYDWTLHMMTNWDSGNILSAYLESLVHAYDPHSDYMNPEGSQTFSIEMSLSLFGIGAQLSEEDGYCTIDSLVPGGPAEKSKQIQPKDKIIAVAQSNQPPVNVVDVDLTKVVSMIRGQKGTQVRLTIQPIADPSARRVISLTREEIKLQDQQAKARLIETPDGRGGTNRIGIVDVPSFYAPVGLSDEKSSDQSYVSEDVSKLLKKLEQEKVQGIILDLRSDPGGSLEEAVRFAGLFIPTNSPVVLARSSDKSINEYDDPDTNVVYTGPLIVLDNRLSASASEIAAGALQDYGRALIVGDTNTFGKGTVQNLMPLKTFIWSNSATNDPGMLKITIRKFYRVSGASTQFKGVASDIVLPDLLDYSPDIGEKSLENALPWDTISGVAYPKLNLVQPYLEQLKERSEMRVATNQDFIYVRQDIKEFKKQLADQSITLNEKKALQERQKNDARAKAENEERAHRKVPDEEIYDITVENADKTGLPAPEALTSTNYVGATNLTMNVHLSNTNALSQLSKTNIVNIAPVDPMLDETERILEDYIGLMSSNRTLVATP